MMHPALVHAARGAVLVVHELVLVDRHDRVAPAREVLAQVGVAAVVALERGAVRRRAAVAARVVAVHEHDDGRARRPVGRVVDRAAQLHAWPRPAVPVSAPPAALGSCRSTVPIAAGRASTGAYGPRAIGSGGAATATSPARAPRRESARARAFRKGHQFSVRSIHECVRARTATTVRGEAARSYVRSRGADVWTAGRKVSGQRPTGFHITTGPAVHVDCGRSNCAPLTAARLSLPDKGPIRSHEPSPRRGGRRRARGARPDQRLRVDLDGRRRQGRLPERRLHLDPGGGQPGSAVGHRRRSARACTSSSRSRRRATTSPSQAGSRNGLTITKPLTIKGAGADKVTIRPAAALGASLAGTAPYLRDGGGNVVTVSRQSGGSSDDNENFVDISGVTIESPDTYAEAALAFFNTCGRLANSRDRHDQVRGRPVHVRRAHDQLAAGRRGRHPARGHDREEPRQRRASSSTTPAAPTARPPRRCARASRPTATSPARASPARSAYTYGQRGSITGSEITGAVVLTDAETGPDPSNPLVRAFSATGSSLLGGLTNTGTAAALVGGNYWGTSTTTGPVETGTSLSEAPAPLSVPAATLDARPDRRDRRPVRPDHRRLGRDDLPGRGRRRRLRRQVRRAHRERPAGRDRRPHAVRVRVHAPRTSTSATTSSWRRRSPTPRARRASSPPSSTCPR